MNCCRGSYRAHGLRLFGKGMKVLDKVNVRGWTLVHPEAKTPQTSPYHAPFCGPIRVARTHDAVPEHRRRGNWTLNYAHGDSRDTAARRRCYFVVNVHASKC